MAAAPQVFLGSADLPLVPHHRAAGAAPGARADAGHRCGRDRPLLPLGDRLLGLPAGLCGQGPGLSRGWRVPLALAGRRARRLRQRLPRGRDRRAVDHRHAGDPVLLGRPHHRHVRRHLLLACARSTSPGSTRCFVGRIGDFPVQACGRCGRGRCSGSILNRHRFGEHLLFIGDNQSTWHGCVGIKVEREKIKLFTLMGVLGALRPRSC